MGYGVKIISRMPGPQRLSWHDLTREGLPAGTKAVVNLAGQNVLDMTRRWTAGFRQNVWNSRINTTKILANAINSATEKPNVFVLMTGVGIYQPNTDTQYTEEHCIEEFDFLSKLCVNWEKAACLEKDSSCRQVTIRSGVVLGKNGGMIKQIYLPFYFGVGGPIGTGNQYLPWIHIDDISRLIIFAIQNEDVDGVMNGVAPEQVTNKEFTKVRYKNIKSILNGYIGISVFEVLMVNIVK